MNKVVPKLTRDFLAAFCEKHKVRALSVFGSAAGPGFQESSDIDILVEFEPGAKVGIMKFTHMQRELEKFAGRRVDLVSKNGLNPIIRDEVIASAKMLYAA